MMTTRYPPGFEVKQGKCDLCLAKRVYLASLKTFAFSLSVCKACLEDPERAIQEAEQETEDE